VPVDGNGGGGGGGARMERSEGGGRGPRNPQIQTQRGGGSSCKVFVGNLSWQTQWQGLKDHFNTDGQVTHADVLMVRFFLCQGVLNCEGNLTDAFFGALCAGRSRSTRRSCFPPDFPPDFPEHCVPDEVDPSDVPVSPRKVPQVHVKVIPTSMRAQFEPSHCFYHRVSSPRALPHEFPRRFPQ
jgi:RNA recognition motif-containing protein